MKRSKKSDISAEIISVGSELLLGHTVNTNATYISRRCSEMGVDVFFHSVVGDNSSRIKEAVCRALERSDVVITTGGMGPTVDDVTVASISDALGKKLVRNKKILKSIKAFFKHRKLKMHKYVSKQADVPRGSKVMVNKVGTAPGIVIKEKDKTVVILPGPPRELAPIFEKEIMPYLEKKYNLNKLILTRTIRTTGVPESHINKKIESFLSLNGEATVGIYARVNEVDIRITAKAGNKTAAMKAVKEVEAPILKRLGDSVFGFDDETLEEAVGHLMKKSGKRLSVAESCTGGLIADRITNVPGSSEYFDRAYVTYTNLAKTEDLEVDEKILKQYGAVSRQTALAMAKGARFTSGSDFALAVTGIAGPGGGKPSKPVGLAYIALVKERKNVCIMRIFKGDRKTVKQLMATEALNLLLKNI